jgi:hypothetical protein
LQGEHKAKDSLLGGAPTCFTLELYFFTLLSRHYFLFKIQKEKEKKVRRLL